MMDAGRELDVLVAVEVMGWAKRTTECNSEQVAIVPPGWTDLSVKRWLGHNLFELVSAYSTSIADAWPIAEKFKMWVFPKGGVWCAGIEGTHAMDEIYVGLEMGVVDGHFARYACAPTAPHAISLAALAAVGAESR